VDESSAKQTRQQIIVSALKYDGTEHRNWLGELVVNEPPLLVVDALFVEEVQHPLLGAISKGTVSTEYYWLDRWYNVFRFGDKGQPNATFYCNVTIPPRLNNKTLSYVDLDIDVFVHSDFTYEVLDLEDFDTNARLYSYPSEIERCAHRAVDELTALIDKRVFPFDR
jgi:protein associated with RNAse G/E